MTAEQLAILWLSQSPLVPAPWVMSAVATGVALWVAGALWVLVITPYKGPGSMA